MNNLPFSYKWVLKNNLEKVKLRTVLDLGCGKGEFGDSYNQSHSYKVTGVDIFKPYLKIVKEKGLYSNVVLGDLRRKLKFKNKSFDAVVCFETIEHLNKKDGQNLIDEMERIAKKAIILSCPVGIANQEDYEENKFQKHQSAWYPHEFQEKGFKVYGIGLKKVYGDDTHVGEKIPLYKKPLFFISFLMNPIANSMPEIGCQMIAVKILK